MWSLWTKRLKSAWSTYRHIAAVKGLLEWIGIWKWIAPAGALAVGTITAYVASLPLYARLLTGLAASSLSVCLAGFVVCLVRVVRHENGNRDLSSPSQVRDAVQIPWTATARSLPQAGSVPSVPLPLSESECYAEWSEMSSGSSLRLIVHNITPQQSHCTVTLMGVYRKSEIQGGRFISEWSPLALYNFQVYRRDLRPEKRNPADEIVRTTKSGFEILSLERNRSIPRSEAGEWRLSLSIKLGQRERRQDLDFRWNSVDLGYGFDWADGIFSTTANYLNEIEIKQQELPEDPTEPSNSEDGRLTSFCSTHI